MPEQLWFTEFLNHHLGSFVTGLLHRIGIQPAYPDAPISDPVAMEVLVVLILIAFFLAVRASLSVENPNGLQHSVEAVQEFLTEQADSVIGHGYERYLPYAIAVGAFILVSNLLGLIPGFESPTASPTVPLGCAVVTFVYYHYHGIRTHGVHYVKQFTGPVWALAPLMIVIEVIS